VRMQAAFQKHCDNAVSKTINFPNYVDIRELEKAFMLAYELKCKGITIYRYGAKRSRFCTLAWVIRKINSWLPILNIQEGARAGLPGVI